MHQYRKINITAEFYSSFPSQPFISILFDYSSSKLRTGKMAAWSGSSAYYVYVTMFPAR